MAGTDFGVSEAPLINHLGWHKAVEAENVFIAISGGEFRGDWEGMGFRTQKARIAFVERRGGHTGAL